MSEIVRTIQIIISTIGGYIGLLVGGVDRFMYVLISFVIIDYITGIMVSILEKRISSDVGFRGIFKKVMIFLMIVIASEIDNYLIKGGSMIRSAVIFFYISNEGISILENASKIGLPIPEKLKNILADLNKE